MKPEYCKLTAFLRSPRLFCLIIASTFPDRCSAEREILQLCARSLSEREGGEFRSPRPNLTAAPFFAVQANLFEKHCGQVGSIFAQFAQFLLAPRDFALWEMPSTDVFRCLVLSIRSYFGLCFSPGFTHGSLSPFDASILQEFTPIGRGFVTLRGGFWTLQKKEERERERAFSKTPWIGSRLISC